MQTRLRKEISNVRQSYKNPKEGGSTFPDDLQLSRERWIVWIEVNAKIQACWTV
jgi:hypothetical protein